MGRKGGRGSKGGREGDRGEGDEGRGMEGREMKGGDEGREMKGGRERDGGRKGRGKKSLLPAIYWMSYLFIETLVVYYCKNRLYMYYWL